MKFWMKSLSYLMVKALQIKRETDYIYIIRILKTFKLLQMKDSNVETFNLNEEKTKVVLTVSTFKEKMDLANNIIIYDIDKNMNSEISNQYGMNSKLCGLYIA